MDFDEPRYLCTFPPNLCRPRLHSPTAQEGCRQPRVSFHARRVTSCFFLPAQNQLTRRLISSPQDLRIGTEVMYFQRATLQWWWEVSRGVRILFSSVCFSLLLKMKLTNTYHLKIMLQHHFICPLIYSSQVKTWLRCRPLRNQCLTLAWCG